MDDLEPLITAVSGMALSVAQMLTTPLVIAASPHWGRRWRDLCPLQLGCWGTPNGKGFPEPQFPFHCFFKLVGLRGPTLWTGWREQHL